MRRTAAVVAAAPRLLLVVSASLVLSVAVLLAPSAPAATVVPSPESVLGFVPGEDRKLADWGQVARVPQGARRAPPTGCRVEEVGKTTQGRPFVIVTVTSEANHARLEEIRRANARLADPRGLGEAEAERLVRERQGRRGHGVLDPLDGGGRHARLAAPPAPPRLERRRPACARCSTATVLLVLPVAQPRRDRPRGRVVPPAARDAVRGNAAAGALPPLRRPRQQPRLVHVHAAGDAAHASRHLYHRWHPQIVHDVHQMGPRGARLFVPPYADPWEPNVDRRARRRRGRARVARGLAPHHGGRTGRRHRRALRRLDAGRAPTPTRTAGCASSPRRPPRASRRRSR